MIVETFLPMQVPRAVRIDFCSEHNRRHYSLSVALPLLKSQQAAGGSPVLYVLDGHWFFGSAVDIVRFNAPGVVVAGISYPDDEAYIKRALEHYAPLPEWTKELPEFRAVVALERSCDLTLPASDEVLARESLSTSHPKAGHVGGLDAFLKVLETEIKPRVASVVRIDEENQTLFGHSLGGMAVVHALFNHPNTFRTFVASSPSIWWSERTVLSSEARFTQAVRAGTAAPRVLITGGSEEETPNPKAAARRGLKFETYVDHIRMARMIGNARELTERLKRLRGSGDFEIEEYVVFPNEAHRTSAWPALARAVSFAFPS
jgi:ferri-bacillibactin esterase